MIWTPAQDALLRERIDAGDTMRQAAAALRVTRNAVAGRMMRLGITSKNPSAGNRTSTSGFPPAKPPRAPTVRQSLQSASASAAGLVQRAKHKKVFSTAYRLADIVAPTLKHAVAFEPLPGTTPKHWTERRAFECTWPVGPDGADQLSCCAPVFKGSWCATHHHAGNVATPRLKMFDPDRRKAA